MNVCGCDHVTAKSNGNNFVTFRELGDVINRAKLVVDWFNFLESI
jgi:hypothetical protein